MDLDDYYDNSLPSKSDFFNGIGSSSVEEINPLIHSYQEEGRAISPPPPPPPLPSQELVSFVENLNEPQAALPDGSHNGMKKASGPFPFLKKRSRREPSAVNKVKVPTSSNEISEASVSKVVPNSQNNYRNQEKKFNEDGEEILPGKSANWDFNQKHGKMGTSSGNSARNSLVDDARDMRSSLASTSSVRLNNNIAAGVEVFRKELEEFEMIERQLENLSLPDTDLANFSIPKGRSVAAFSQQTTEADPLNQTKIITNFSATASGSTMKSYRSNNSSWGAVTQPVGSIVADRPAESFTYSANFENRQQKSASTTSTAATNFSKMKEAVSSSSASRSSGENTDNDEVHIIRTRPLSGNRPSSRPSISQPANSSGSKLNLFDHPNRSAFSPADSTIHQTDIMPKQLITKSSGGDSIPPLLALKAKELEEELETYRNENSNLKKLRKQQETALADIVQQREQVLKWVAEEKQKTNNWCEEQKLAIAKEKRAAAKYIRDVKEKTLTNTSSIRKEKTEIEGLQAALHKAKIDYDAATKKWKLNENRLYSLIKDHSAHIDDLEKKISTLEEEKLLLLEFIQESNLHIPKHIRSKLQNTLLNASLSNHSRHAGGSNSGTGSAAKGRPSTPTSKMSTSQSRAAAYVEEVDVDVVPSASMTVTKVGRDSLNATSKRPESRGRENDVSRSSTARLSQPNTFSDEAKLSKTIGTSTPSKGGMASGLGLGPAGSGNLLASTSSWSKSSATHSSGRYSFCEDAHDIDDAEAAVGDAELDDLEADQDEQVALHEDSHSAQNGSRRKANVDNDERGDFTSSGTIDFKQFSGVYSKSRNGESSQQIMKQSSLKTEGDGHAHFVRSPFSGETKSTGFHNGQSETILNSNKLSNYDLGIRGRDSGLNEINNRNTEPAQLGNENRSNPSHISSSAGSSNGGSGGGISGIGSGSSSSSGGRVEETLPSGGKLIRYANGTTKEISPDGASSIVRFTNGDYKRTDSSNGVVVYFYKLAETTHTTFKDGLEVYEFPNKQVEKHYANGIKEILFPDSTRKIIKPDGVQESYFPDGVILRELPDGTKQILNER